MAKRRVFEIRLTAEATQHFASIESKHHNLIAAKIFEQLSHNPDVPTRNRKPMRMPAPYDATWELRCGPQSRFRVFYVIDVESLVVNVVAVGEKIGNRLLIGGEEMDS